MRLMFENNLITMQLLSALKEIIESLIIVEFSLIFQLFIGKRFPFFLLVRVHGLRDASMRTGLKFIFVTN